MNETARAPAFIPPHAPPFAAEKPHREVRHGEIVDDPWRWLREKDNPEVTAYLEAENAYTSALTEPVRSFEDALYKEILSRIKQTDLSVPVRRGSHWYYSRTVEGLQYSIRCRRKGSMEAPEQVLLDQNELAKGHEYFALGDMAVSDNENLLAYSTDVTGFRQYTLQVKDLLRGELTGDTVERVTSVAWAADDTTLFFTTEDAVTKRSDCLWRMKLGGSPALLYREEDELFSIHVGRTKDRQYLIVEAHSTDTWESRLLRADDAAGEFGVLYPREKGHKYDVDHRDGVLYVRSNRDAKNFRVVTVPLGSPAPENWRELVAHDADVLVEAIELFRDFAVLHEKSEGLTRLRIHDFAGGHWHSIAFPESVYVAYGSGTPEFDSRLFRLSYESMITPPTIYDYDMGTRERRLLKQQEVLGGYEPTRYRTERLWAKARDGQRVPISIVYPKDFQRNGEGPLYLYAYGSYGHGMDPHFSTSRLSLLDRGFAYAIAHVRGGDDLGEAWHDDGMLMSKKNSFFDFIDCAEHLVGERWSSPSKLVIEGGSAGGLLIGAVLNLRPELFGAAHLAVPFVDVMNTMLDDSLPLTVGEYLEWGDPHEKEAYDYMKSYSPYDNIERKAYPAMLVTTSLNDSQVMYWEPAKYVAKLRRTKIDDNPLLLKTNMGAGHHGASGRYDHLKEIAFEYAWLMAQVGISC
jgi:oligopeptidase B